MGKYKYFTDEEVADLKDELALKLDQMRDAAGVPITISRPMGGFRTADQNLTIGGKPNSAHLKGLASDIPCTDSHIRYMLVKAAYAVGFRRIEVCTAHIHVDCDETLPQDVMPVDISH